MGVFDWLTGKTVETKVDEYSEVYGEVVLGLHRDLEVQKRVLDDHHESLKRQDQLLLDHGWRVDVQQQSLQRCLQDLETHELHLGAYRKDFEAQAQVVTKCHETLHAQHRLLQDHGQDLLALRKAAEGQRHEISTLVNKVNEHSETFREMLQGLQRELEIQKRALHDCRQRLDSHYQLLHDQVQRIDAQQQLLQRHAEDLKTQGDLLRVYRQDSDAQARVLAEYHQRLETQDALLQNHTQGVLTLEEAFESQRRDLDGLANASRGVESRLEGLNAQTSGRLEGLQRDVEELQQQVALLETVREELGDLARDFEHKRTELEARLAIQDEMGAIIASQAKQLGQLRLLCMLSYVFALGLGVMLWIIR